MKMRTTIIIGCVAFIVGAVGGFGISSYLSGRLLEFQIVASSLNGVSASYTPLKFLKDGEPEKATTVLEVQLDGAMHNLELMSETLHRPDILTNSSVINAKALR